MSTKNNITSYLKNLVLSKNWGTESEHLFSEGEEIPKRYNSYVAEKKDVKDLELELLKLKNARA